MARYVYNSIFFSFAADRLPNPAEGAGHTPSETPGNAPSEGPGDVTGHAAGHVTANAELESALADQTSYASSNADLVREFVDCTTNCDPLRGVGGN